MYTYLYIFHKQRDDICVDLDMSPSIVQKRSNALLSMPYV